MKLTGIREKVFLDRYALKGAKGDLLEHEPSEMWRRVAKGIAKNEKKSARKTWENKFYNVMADFKFVPGGRILSGAGTDYQVTYFNCFVIPSPKDSREGIVDALKQLIEIQSRSGGVGLNLSSLRPRGARVKKVNGTSSGPVTWAGLFSYATHDVVQQGGTRRGATMLMLWDWHPDIEEFITVKKDLSRINGANLSVCISDAFMEAVKKDADWDLVYPDLDDLRYDEKWNGEIDQWKKMGGKVKIYKTVKARYLWNLICEAAWGSAEPGLHFLERSNKRSNTWYFESLVATNPCGEQPLGPWAVCNLGAMNLASYVKVDSQFDYKQLGEDVKVAIRFLDNVIDKTYYFFKENKKCAKDIRRTGLGIMGLGDALIKMKVRYGLDESLKIIDKIFETLRNSAYEASSEIAKEKGPFPKFDKTKYLKGYHIKELPAAIRKKISRYGIRNAVLLTIAPTGTTSLLAGVTSGIEPVYEFTFIRRDRTGEHVMYHPLFEEWKKENAGKEKSFDSAQDRPDYFVSANDLTPLEHAQVQAVAQKYIDASISKTVNAPNTHTVEDVKTLYMAAYDLGLKGVTYAIQTPVGKTYITINHNEEKEPFEVFITIGKSGSDVAAMADALGRMISLNFRLSGGLAARERIRQVVAQLTGIGGARSVGFGENRVRSLPDAVAKVLARHYSFRVNGIVEDSKPQINVANGNGHTNGNGLNGHGVKVEVKDKESASENIVVMQQLPIKEAITADLKQGTETHLFDICPECGSGSLAYEEGCRKCYACGHSEC